MKRIMYFLLALCLMAGLAGCSDGGKDKNKLISGNSITPMPETTKEETVSESDGTSESKAVLIDLDADKMQIIIKDIYSGNNYVLSYNGGTDVRNVYDEIISMAQLSEGEIVDVTFDEEKKKAKKVYVSKDVFRSSNISGFKAVKAKTSITFGSASYMYTDTLVVISDGKILDPTEVMSRDVVTVRGIDNKIYSVSVDKGHGYLTFTGAEEFVGGMVEIGRSFLYTVSSDMMIVVPEGEYTVVMSNKGMEAKKTVYITKDMTVTMDFSEYQLPAGKIGTVEFQILPKGTDLFIEGNKTDYSKPVVLDFGTYIINLLSDDYETYTTKITVNSTYRIETFDLKKIYADNTGGGSGTTETTSSKETSSSTATTTTATVATTTQKPTSSTSETTAATSGAIKVTISEPAGAGVYVNNVYMGTAPLTINKDAGEYVITFKREGYITKSYIVDVDSSEGEQTLAFPAMSEE